MKNDIGPAYSRHDFASLVAALERLARLAPAPYPNWASIAKDGADAARVEDADAVKAACRGCHNQYRERYKKDMRDRAL